MKCEICDNADNNKSFKIKEMMYGIREEFEYMECNKCGCIQILEIPSDMSKYYPKDFHVINEKENIITKSKRYLINKRDYYDLSGKSFLGKLVSKYFEPNKSFALIHDLIESNNINLDSSVLDVGCGLGIFLQQLSQAGFTNLTGIDLFVEESLIIDNLNIMKTSLENYNPNKKYDFIVLNHSFEHMEEPLESLKDINNLLMEEGIVMIKIPLKTEYIWDLYGVNWVQLDAPRHFYSYTLEAFNILAKKAGFEIQETIYESNDFQFVASELYKQDIPLKPQNEYEREQSQKAFTKSQIKEFRKKANELNENKQGDSVILLLNKRSI